MRVTKQGHQETYKKERNMPKELNFFFNQSYDTFVIFYQKFYRNSDSFLSLFVTFSYEDETWFKTDDIPHRHALACFSLDINDLRYPHSAYFILPIFLV